MNKEKRYKQCYVAFIDIMGFKEMIKTKNCEYIYEIFSTKFKKKLKQIYRGTTLLFDIDDIKMKVMSDSICFYVDSNIKNALVGLICLTANFQNELLCFKEPILSRGAIVHGDIYSENEIIYGPAFVDAYLKEEHIAKYPRIILDNGLIDMALSNSDEDARAILHQLSLFDFDGNLVVDYWQIFNNFNRQKSPEVLRYAEKMISENKNPSIVEKYTYLMSQLLRNYKTV